MNDVYNKYKAEYEEKKSLVSEIHLFRFDDRTMKYGHIRSMLGLAELGCVRDIKTMMQLMMAGLQGHKIDEIKKDKIKPKQFDSCSYDELTHCVIARIQWIREYIEMLYDSAIVKEYPSIVNKIKTSIENNRNEIKQLLKMRHILKRSDLKNWDSDRLNI